VKQMDSTDREAVSNADRPTDQTEGVTETMGGRKYEPGEVVNAGPTRRGFLAGGLVASAATLVSNKAAAAGGTTPASVYRIHPAIGVARLGNAPSSTYYIGPEVPGLPPLGDAPGTTAPPFKVNGQIKPQAVRFRIFEYQWVNGVLTPIREVTLDTPGVRGISWSAHLANKKASFYKFRGPLGEKEPPAALRNATETNRRSLEIDFGGRTINGRSLGPVEFRAGTSGNPAHMAVAGG